MGKKRKAQITFFIAFLLIMFLIVGFFLFHVSQVSKEPLTDPIPVNAQTVFYMVQSCFDTATDQALLLSARSSGFIHDPSLDFLAPNNSQGEYGKEVIPYKLGDNITFTGYGVRRDNGTHSLLDAPSYPYEGELIPNHMGIFTFNFNPFPINVAPFSSFKPYQLYLTPLCSRIGRNEPNFAHYVRSCLTYNNPVFPKNIQNIMEDYATKYLINCTYRGITNAYGYVDIDLTDVYISSYIGETDVIFDLNYNVNYGNLIETYKFSSRKNARLKYAYDLAACIINEDAKNVFFDMTDENALRSLTILKGYPDVIEEPCFKNLFSVERIKNSCVHANVFNNDINCSDNKWNYTDVIKITDNRSSISGEKLIFAFAVENRRPALDLINFVSGDLADYYDIVAYSGALLKIDPEGFDPDQDFYNDFCNGMPCMGRIYNYSGWKADYDEIFNFSLDTLDNVTGIINLTGDEHIIFNEEINISEPKNSSEDIVLPLNRNFNPNMNVSCWRGDNLVSAGPPPAVCLDDKNLWQSSDLYVQTNRSATVQTTLEDAGPHIVRVTIYDRESLFDFQDIRILIKPLLGGGLNPYTQYEILPEQASWEDNYTISVQSSLLNQYGNNLFIWNDTCSNNSNGYILGSGTIGEDNEFALISFDKNIFDPSELFNFSINLTKKLNSCDHSKRLNLTILENNNNLVFTNTFPLNVTQCIPLRLNSPAFPYNNFTSPNNFDIFLTNHTCCDNSTDNWGNYSENNIVCFNYQNYSSFYYLNNTFVFDDTHKNFTNVIAPANYSYSSVSHNNGYPARLEKNDSIRLTLYGNIPGLTNLTNDIIFRNFTQFCSGDRGNVCSGEIFDNGTIIQCNDKDTSKGEIASCQWPCDPNDGNCNATLVASATIGPACYNVSDLKYDVVNDFYPSLNMSFEKDFLGITDGDIGRGFCNPNLKCSSNYYTYNDSVGLFLNKAVCNNDGTCSAGYMVHNCSSFDKVYLENTSNPSYNIYYYHEPTCISRGSYTDNDECGNLGEPQDLDNNTDGMHCNNALVYFNINTCDGDCWVPHFEYPENRPGNYSNFDEPLQCCGDDKDEIFSSNTSRFSPPQEFRGCCNGTRRYINQDGLCVDEDILIQGISLSCGTEINRCVVGQSIQVNFTVSGGVSGGVYTIKIKNSSCNFEIVGGSNLNNNLLSINNNFPINTCQSPIKITEAWIYENNQPLSRFNETHNIQGLPEIHFETSNIIIIPPSD